MVEKEVSLLRQAEKLHKNHEDNKVAEVASTIQHKLAQKKQKIELLKAKLASTESNYDILKKVRQYIENEGLLNLKKKFKLQT